MRMHKNLLAIMLVFIGLSFNLLAGGFNANNDPTRMMQVNGQTLYMEKVYERLATQAQIERLPWACTYWPTYKGGITYRYRASQKDPEFFKGTRPLPIDQIASLIHASQYDAISSNRQRAAERLNMLSPAEKMDLVNGVNANGWWLTQKELKRTLGQRRDIEPWEGLCDGWAVAAIRRPEPKPVTIPISVRAQAADGREYTYKFPLTFYSSDIKALIILMESNYSYKIDPATGQQYPCRTSTCGTRLNDDPNSDPSIRTSDAYRDINPGAFHLILTNRISQNASFIFDRSLDVEVWNQPIEGYKVLDQVFLAGPSNYMVSAAGTVYEVRVKTRVFWTQEAGPADYPMNSGDGRESFRQYNDYTYILELNARREIIGGRWTGDSINNHPDFVWDKDEADFTGPFVKLAPIYQASIR